MQATKLFLTALEQYTYTSSLSVLSDESALNNNCNATLYDAVANYLDSKVVYFNTTEVKRTSKGG